MHGRTTVLRVSIVFSIVQHRQTSVACLMSGGGSAHLDGQHQAAAVGRELAVDWPELAHGLVLQPLRLEPHHRAALRPAVGRSLVR